MLKRILNEPLSYFFVIACLLFVFNLQTQQQDELIRVEAETISYLFEQQQQRQRHPLDSAQKQALIDQHVDQEVLYREAQRNGLDNDSRIRQQLVQKMLLLLSEEVTEPTEEQLKAFYEANLSRYVQPEGRDFEQVYFTAADAIPKNFLQMLASDENRARAHSDSSLYFGDQLPHKSEQQLLLLFGKEATARLMEISDSSWHGPIASKQGSHFIRLTNIYPAEPEEYVTVRPYLAREWQTQQHEEQLARAIEKLRSRYPIETEWPRS